MLHQSSQTPISSKLSQESFTSTAILSTEICELVSVTFQQVYPPIERQVQKKKARALFMESPTSPPPRVLANSQTYSRLGNWILTLVLLRPAIFILFPASFGVPNLLSSLKDLWLQVRLLGRAEMATVLILLIYLAVFSFLYVRQLRFLVSEYQSWHSYRAPASGIPQTVNEDGVRPPTLAERRRRTALTAVIPPQIAQDLRSPTTFKRED